MANQLTGKDVGAVDYYHGSALCADVPSGAVEFTVTPGDVVSLIGVEYSEKVGLVVVIEDDGMRIALTLDQFVDAFTTSG